MEKDYRIALFIIIGALILGLGFGLDLVNPNTQQHKILSIDKIEKVSGDSEGFTTELYYQVATDKGSYRIETHGLNAAPQCAGIKKDSVYTLTTRGANIPFFGVYPNIIDAKPCK